MEPASPPVLSKTPLMFYKFPFITINVIKYNHCGCETEHELVLPETAFFLLLDFFPVLFLLCVVFLFSLPNAFSSPVLFFQTPFLLLL